MASAYDAHHVADALGRMCVVVQTRGLGIPQSPGVTNSPEELQQRWQVVSSVAGDGSGELDPTTLEHLKVIYNYVETVIVACGTPDSFDVYEVCFETLAKMGFYLQSQAAKDNLTLVLEDVHEVYDVLLSCVETYEWVQVGATGSLRLWMLKVVFACLGFNGITGLMLMALTDNDVSGAVSLISYMLRCSDAPFEMQQTAGRCLVELTTADSVFLSELHRESADWQNEAISKLTSMLNKHVNELIKALIQFDVVEAFGRCICQHQMSHARTDIIVRGFLTTIHNCLLYCSENQKNLRQHLATQSTVVQDIMIPYVYNILPALYEMPSAGPQNIEWQNLKSTLQTFVVVTFNINVFRPQLRDGDMIPKICAVPNILGHISMLELLVKMAINIDFTKGPYHESISSTLHSAFAALPQESQRRLQRRLTSEQSMRLPYAKTNHSVESLRLFCTPPLGEETKEIQAQVAAHNKYRKKEERAANNIGRKRKRLFNQQIANDEGNPGDSSDDDDMPPLIPAAQWEPCLGPQDQVSSIPTRALCELTGALMTDPVMTPEGNVYERAALEDWMVVSASNPKTGQPLSMEQCSEAKQIQEYIQTYQMQMISACEIAPEAFEQPAKLEDAPKTESACRLLGDLPSLATNKPPSPTNKKSKGKIRIASRSVVECPDEMRCAIDGKVCIDPVRSPYGHLFEKKTLDKWMQNCGSVCPVTSKPLRAEECAPDHEMKKAIKNFLKNQQ
mmetsp:Transcript_40165/g.63763  ORF Transcript_40165/g.63763 Transcript_40165/m.63763 type:complete len:734 (-) Transcript_40165:217-2418(-)|eukprot:CAMPEP_0169188934 /NCGR_PEP_ID=MMETSP1016-20121227/3727_1 /TAXON_ID=342587 /ORGANISM="Karlodinium micrum, Strain CCMP2283" /LENGTH=733 /DNA_ID=CAMNT_0009265003 /DNA_START=50 /DNA_END=2251 /DNA_ORIENTATION=-